MSQLRALSPSSLAILDCACRALDEAIAAAEGKPRRTAAMERGDVLHQLTEKVNRMVKAGKDLGPEDIQGLVEASMLNLADAVWADDRLLWYAERMVGAKPYLIEQRIQMEAAGAEWNIKLDQVRLDDETGQPFVDEYKMGARIPDREHAKRNMQLMVYAFLLSLFLKVPKVTLVLWNFESKFNLPVEFDTPLLESIGKYLGGAVAKRAIPLLDMMEAMKGDADALRKLKERPEFKPTPNAFCNYCDSRWACPAFMGQLMPERYQGDAETGLLFMHQVRLASRLSTALWEKHKDALKGMASDAGGEALIGGYVIKVVTKPRHYNALPARDVNVTELVFEKEGPCDVRESTEPSGTKPASDTSPKGGGKPAGTGKAALSRSSATSAKKSAPLSSSPRSRKGASTTRAGTMSTTRKGGVRTRKAGST